MSFPVVPARTQEGVLQIQCGDAQCTVVMVVLVGKPLIGVRTHVAARRIPGLFYGENSPAWALGCPNQIAFESPVLPNSEHTTRGTPSSLSSLSLLLSLSSSSSSYSSSPIII